MTPEQRAHVAERFAEHDPAFLAAVQIRKIEKEAFDTLALYNEDIESLRPFKYLHLGPKLRSIDSFMMNLAVEHSLRIGNPSRRESITQVSLYNSSHHRLELHEEEEPPQEGELVLVTNSVIYQTLPGRNIIPIFEPVVRPLKYIP